MLALGNPEAEIECFYAGDKRLLSGRKRLDFSGMDGGKLAVSIQQSAFFLKSRIPALSRVRDPFRCQEAKGKGFEKGYGSLTRLKAPGIRDFKKRQAARACERVSLMIISRSFASLSL